MFWCVGCLGFGFMVMLVGVLFGFVYWLFSLFSEFCFLVWISLWFVCLLLVGFVFVLIGYFVLFWDLVLIGGFVFCYLVLMLVLVCFCFVVLWLFGFVGLCWVVFYGWIVWLFSCGALV